MKHLLFVVLVLNFFFTMVINASGEIVNIIYDKSKTVNDVIQDIHSQTGYQIIIDEGLRDVPINGKYLNVEIEPFLLRIFKGYNVSIITSVEQKICYVETLGSRRGRQVEMSSRGAPSDTEANIEDIKKLHAEQQREIQAYLDNENAKDSQSGEKLSVIRALHLKQQDEIAKFVKDTSRIEPLSGMSISEMQEMQEEQQNEIESFKNSLDDIVDDETGMTLGQIHLLHEEQQEGIKKLYE